MPLPECPFDGLSTVLIGEAPRRAVKVNEQTITCLELVREDETGTHYKILGFVIDVQEANRYLLGNKIKFRNIILPGGITDGKATPSNGKDSGGSGTGNEGGDESSGPPELTGEPTT